ncbi:STAS domain-containing protein [Nonomuraea sp. NPDC002799]
MTSRSASPTAIDHPWTLLGQGRSGDHDASKALRRQLLDTLRHSTNLLILDLSQVSFCDSSGLAVLVGIQHRARIQGITLTLANLRPYTSHVLRLTGLDRSLQMMV